jgi:DNA replication protein DnaC
MSTADTLGLMFQSLGLRAMQREYVACIVNAENENWGYWRLIQRLLEIEAAARLARKVDRLLDDSDLPPQFTLERLNPSELNDKPRRMLPSLVTGDFVRRGDNVLCFGLPGRGKTHYVAAIARELIRQQQMKVLFIESYRLVSRLLVAKRDHALPEELVELGKYDIICLDDVGYVQHSADEMEVLFTFLADRYQQQRTLMLTSNLVFSEWDRIFKNPMTAMAVVDRLVHRAVILELVRENSLREAEAHARNN